MKIKQLTTLKHKLQWLLLLAALLGVSQGVWADTYPENTPVYVRSTTQYSTVAIHVWGGTASTSWPGQTMSYMGQKDSYYYWTYTFSGTFTNMIVTDGDNTKYSGSADGTVTSGKNCITVTGSGYSWSSESISVCDFLSAPTDVINGTNVMFYINQDYNDDALCIHNGTTYISGTYSGTSRVYYINTAKTNITSKTINVTNNCSGWTGTGGFTNVAAGSKLKTGNQGTSTVSATTLNTFSASSTSITAGTASIDLTIKGTSGNSSNDKSLYALIYIGTTLYGCKAVTTSNQTISINTSSLATGSYTIKAVLSDGTIYYLNSSNISLTVTPACSAPTASGFTMDPTSVTYDGSSHSVDVTPESGYGAVSDIKYNNSSTAPTAVGNYTVTADIAAEGDWCAVDDLEIGTFSIIKRNQSTLSITTSIVDRCTGTLPLQLEVSGGSTSGTVTYAETAHTGTVSVSSSGSITASTDASITVTATMAGDDTYNDVVSAAVTFTFTESPVIYLTGTGAKGASATYPWEYMTITVDRDPGKTSPSDLDVTFTEEPSFSSGTAPAHSVTITGEEGDKTYKLKSAKTVNDAHYYTVKANGSNGSCAAAEASYNVYIDSAPAEVCE